MQLDAAASEDRRHLIKLSLCDDSEEDQVLKLLAYSIVEKETPRIDYKELHHLGHGGYGTVYEVTFLDHAFAVKVFNSSESSFDRELASNKHPNILAVAGNSKKQPCIVMEKMDMDLREFLLKTKLSLPEALEILLQIATSKDIIHRDLKLQNVLISMHNGIPVVKIADFGLSRTNFVTALGNAATPGLGTRLAPEVWSSKCYSKRSDVFGYVMICYQVLTGRNPFEKDDFEGTDFMLRVREGLRPREEFPTDCPPELVPSH